MKIAQQFRAFLETHYYLPLPSIGKLEIISPVSEPEGVEIRTKQFRFIPDAANTSDKSLIEFISKKMKIETSIAESDLACFCNSLKELLMQGFEAEIPGIGFLHVESNSKLKFSILSIYNAASPKIRKRIPTITASSFWF